MEVKRIKTQLGQIKSSLTAVYHATRRIQFEFMDQLDNSQMFT